MDEKQVTTMTHEILRELFHQIMHIQERFIENSTDVRLSRTEIHIVEEIGDKPFSILTDIANKMGITKATASVCVNRLIEKEMVQKSPINYDKRKHGLVLTQKGEDCNRAHAKFHEMLIESLMDDFNLAERDILLQGLKQMLDFFKQYY